MDDAESSNGHTIEKMLLALSLFITGALVSARNSGIGVRDTLHVIPLGLISIGFLIILDSRMRNGEKFKWVPGIALLALPFAMILMFFTISTTSGLLYSLLFVMSMLHFLLRDKWLSFILRSFAAALIFLAGGSVFGINETLALLSITIFFVFAALELMWEVSLDTDKYRYETLSALYGEKITGMVASIFLFVGGTILLLPVKLFGMVHVKVGAIFMAVLFYCAYKMLLDPEKYAKESYVLGASFSIFMLAALFIEALAA